MGKSFLILGCGSIGKRHIANLRELDAGEIVAFDPNANRRNEVQEKFGVRTANDAEEALAANPAAVFICSPTHLHVEQAIAAARAGAHLFIEKPLSHQLRDVDVLMQEVESRGLVALTGCNFRFHPGLQKVKELLAEGVAGRICSVRAAFGHYLPDWHPWEDYRLGYSARREMGGGVILDRIHELDYLYWLFGEAVQVAAFAGHLSSLDIDSEDTAEILLRFACGAFGSVHLDYVRRTYDCSLEITGELGCIEWSFPRHEVRWYTAELRQWQSQSWPNYAVNDMYLDELRHFLRAIEGTEPPEQTLEEARTILATALSAKQAAAEGRPMELLQQGRQLQLVL